MSSASASGSRPSRSSAVCLVGFMGAGKSSVGRELARRLQWEFVDLDTRIEARTGKKVSQIFAAEGEAAFRKLESDELQHLVDERAELGPVVMAVGGGAFIDARNRSILSAAGVPSVFLEVSLEEARRRCSEEAGQRPLMKDQSALANLFRERSPKYAMADVKVATDGLTVAQVADAVITRLGLFPGAAVEEEK